MLKAVWIMFGYVRLHKPSITMGEYQQYQGIYCTLCKRIGKRYGVHARFTLSYDMTFLALLGMALEADEPDFCRSRCSFNPTKRCLKCRRTDKIDLAADLGVLLTYYKVHDTLHDERGPKRWGAALLYPLAALDRRRAARRRPTEDAAIATMMQNQREIERQGVRSVDRAAEPFAMMLASLAAALAEDEKSKRILDRFGYCLGRWVYLIDAADDLSDDLKKNNYNPYILSRNIQKGNENDLQDAKNYAVSSLNACLSECIAAYNLLDGQRFDGILRNILEKGMPAVQRRVITGKECADERSV